MPNLHKNEMHAAGDVAETPIIRMTHTGKKVGHVTVAVTTGKSTERLRVTLWEALAEKAAALMKGDFVQVIGRLQTRSFNDRTGRTCYATEVVASEFTCPEKEPTAEPKKFVPAFADVVPERQPREHKVAQARPVSDSDPIGPDNIPF